MCQFLLGTVPQADSKMYENKKQFKACQFLLGTVPLVHQVHLSLLLLKCQFLLGTVPQQDQGMRNGRKRDLCQFLLGTVQPYCRK